MTATVPAAAAPPPRLLLGPGPSPVPDAVLAAQSRPVVGHLDPAFLDVMDEVAAMLRAVFRTDNPLTFPVSGTGSAGMETAIVNVVEPGDTVIVGVNGVFGARLTDTARRAGADVVTLEEPWGHVIAPDRVADALAAHPEAKAVVLVHAETSTGAHQPLAQVGEVVAGTETLLVVDAVTSLGGVPVEVDEWGLDVVYSGTQKCLSVPPGLSPVTFSPKAERVLDARREPVRSWYLDVTAIRRYWEGDDGGGRAYHHTAPISAVYGLHEGLRLVLGEGLDARWARHRQVGAHLQGALEERGGRLLADPDHRLPQLTAVGWSDTVDEAAWRRRLLHEHGVEVGGGLGAFAGSAWRIGLMGHGAQREHVDHLLAAMDAAVA